MKKLLFYFLLPVIAFSCKSGQTAEDYFDAGSAKMQEKPDPTDKLLIYKVAMQDFDKAIALNPAYIDAYEKRSVIRRGLGDYTGCIQDAEKIISIDPKNKNAFYFIGQSKLFHKDYSGSIKAYSEAISLDSTFTQCYYERGRDEKELHNYTDALKDYSHAIAISSKGDPFYKSFYFSRGELKLEMNDKDGACTDFHKSVELGNAYAQSFIDEHCK